MLATTLDSIPGVSAAGAKAIIVIVLGALSAGLVALVQDGTISGALATLAPIIAGAITAIAVVIDPNATHAT
jgi:hypothetical protein